MESSMDLKIIGIDPERPPKIQQRPCVDLFYQLNESANEDWCRCFASISGKQVYSFKINPEGGEFIETWVKKPSEIARSLETAKSLVARCNEVYVELLDQRRRQAAVVIPDEIISPEQKALNDIVSQLVFED